MPALLNGSFSRHRCHCRCGDRFHHHCSADRLTNPVITPRRLILTALSLSACESPQVDAARRSADQRDSSGISIVTNSQPERLLTLTQFLRVGVVEGNPELQFDAVRTVAVDSAGGFWVVDRNPSIRHYDASGNYVRGVGSRGEGPGEARSYGHIWLANDTILAWASSGVLQSFTADGKFIDSKNAFAGETGMMLPLGSSAGRWILSRQVYSMGAEKAFRRQEHIYAATSLAATPDSIATFPGQLSIRAGSGNEFGRASWFFGNPHMAVDAQGHLFVSDTSAYRISVYDLDGKMARVIERPQAPRTIDPAWRADIEDGVFKAASRDGQSTVNRADVSRMVEQILVPGLPTHLPFIQNILVSPNGTLWVERADRDPKPGMRAVAHAMGWIRHAWRPEWIVPRVYDIFAPTGEYRGTVEVPGTFEPMAVTADAVYGVSYDSMGVEFIVAQRLTDNPPD
jgi:hypothetical protein